MDPVFWRRLRHFWSYMNNNFTLQFCEIFYVGQGGWTKLLERKHFSDLGFSNLGCWRLMGWDSMGIPSDQSIRFPSVPLVCTKTFPVGCAPDNRNSSVFALAPPTLDIFFLLTEGFTPTGSATQIFMALPLTAWRSVVDNWSYGYVLILQNKKLNYRWQTAWRV